MERRWFRSSVYRRRAERRRCALLAERHARVRELGSAVPAVQALTRPGPKATPTIVRRPPQPDPAQIRRQQEHARYLDECLRQGLKPVDV